MYGRGHRIGLRRVERLMREHGIRARHKLRYKATTDSKHSMPVAANLLARNFTPEVPNRVWTGDITYIQAGEELHPCPLSPCLSNRVQGQVPDLIEPPAQAAKAGRS